jgi:hypothetical protein
MQEQEQQQGTQVVDTHTAMWVLQLLHCAGQSARVMLQPWASTVCGSSYCADKVCGANGCWRVSR